MKKIFNFKSKIIIHHINEQKMMPFHDSDFHSHPHSQTQYIHNCNKKHEQKHIKITKHAIKWIDEPHTK